MVLRALAIIAASLTLLVIVAPSRAGYHRADAKKAAASYGWTGYQWDALDAIIRPESGWESCRRYPSTTDCGYTGSNSCGIPQANPCPAAWRGRLGSSWREQIVWLLQYVRGRYGSPASALAFRRAHNWY